MISRGGTYSGVYSSVDVRPGVSATISGVADHAVVQRGAVLFVSGVVHHLEVKGSAEVAGSVDSLMVDASVPEVLALGGLLDVHHQWRTAVAGLATVKPHGTHREEDRCSDRLRQDSCRFAVADPGQQWRVRSRNIRCATGLDAGVGW